MSIGRMTGRIESGSLPSQLELDAIAAATADGLSLGQAAALAGVAHGRLVLVVALADAGYAPFAAWLLGLQRTSAESRRALLSDLRQLGAVDARARRDWLRERAQPSPLERELAELRRQAERSESVQVEVSSFGQRLAMRRERPPLSEDARAEMGHSFHFSEADGDGG